MVGFRSTAFCEKKSDMLPPRPQRQSVRQSVIAVADKDRQAIDHRIEIYVLQCFKMEQLKTGATRATGAARLKFGA